MNPIEFVSMKQLAKNNGGSSGGYTNEEWFNDGDTHIWITLDEGRTSPMLGVCPNGTVTVDWGDGTEPDVLTGTSTSTVKWTPKHNYAKHGDYVIKLTVNDGEILLRGIDIRGQYAYILRNSKSTDNINSAYQNAILRVEIGKGVSIGNYAFYQCYALTSIKIPDSVASIGNYAFYQCYALTSVTIAEGVTSIGNSAFYYCCSLKSIKIPDSVKNIAENAFGSCNSLTSIAIGKGVTSIDNDVFNSCYSVASIKIPDGVTSIGNGGLSNFHSLKSITIPDGVTYIGNNVFYNWYALTFIKIPDSVASIGNYAFSNCFSVSYVDFTKHTYVPTLGSNAFNGIAKDCEIRVPAALYDEWIAAENWSTYASQIVAVE